MLESPVRVALLARPGDARDQLRRALAELGAQLVAEGDPAELDPATVAAENPTVVLVSLEPAVEDSLARFDDLLAAPGIDVMYDDAETTRQLDGWDLARWARHLAAKLVGTDLLPPPPGGSDHLPEMDLSLEPGAPMTPAQEMDHAKLEDYAAESLDLSDWVPTTPSLASEPVADATPAEVDADEHTLDLDLGDLELAMDRLQSEAPPVVEGGLATDSSDPQEWSAEAELSDSSEFTDAFQPSEPGEASDLQDAGEALPSSFEALASSESSLDFEDSLEIAEAPLALADDEELSFDAGDLDIDLSALPEEGSPMVVAASDELSLSDDEPLLVDLQLPSEPVKFSSFSDEEAPVAEHMDDDVAALAAQLEAFEAQDQRQAAAQPDFLSNVASPQAAEPQPSTPAPPPKAAGDSFAGFGSLELMPMDADVAAPAAEPPPMKAKKTADNGRLSLADADATGNNATSRGALLILAGLGGPDAVRQLLAVLPPTLPVPVLLYQHLDTGKHDRLVGQLSKASGLPLNLAIEGKLAFPGRVAVLQPGVGVHFSDDSFVFNRVDSLSQVVSALPAADSAVLVLSGADPAVLPAVLALHAQGALILAQDPGLCFDAVAASAVIEAGAVTASPAELARLVIERWK